MLLKFGDERIKVYSLFKKGKRSLCYWIEGLKREKKTQVYCKAKERDKRKEGKRQGKGKRRTGAKMVK